MKPLVRGEETDLVEIGANWYVDDLPPMMFIKKAPNSQGSSTRGTWRRSGAISSTGSTASMTTRSSPSPSIPTSLAGPRSCSCWSA